MANHRTMKCLMWNARGLETRQCKKLEEQVITNLFQEYGHNWYSRIPYDATGTTYT